MASAQNGDATAPASEADLAQAFKELQRGEQTAAALENHLNSIEKKIEELLAQADQAEKELKEGSKPETPAEPKPETKSLE